MEYWLLQCYEFGGLAGTNKTSGMLMCLAIARFRLISPCILYCRTKWSSKDGYKEIGKKRKTEEKDRRKVRKERIILRINCSGLRAPICTVFRQVVWIITKLLIKFNAYHLIYSPTIGDVLTISEHRKYLLVLIFVILLTFKPIGSVTANKTTQ